MRFQFRAATNAVAAFSWYPLLLVLAWSLRMFPGSHVEPAAAVRPLLIVIAAAVAMTLVSTRWFGRERGALIAAFTSIALIAIRDGATAIAFVAAFLLLSVEVVWAARGRVRLPWRRIHNGLTVFAVVLIAVQATVVAADRQPVAQGDLDAWAEQPLNDARRPDIFLILADAHGRQDILRDAYAYDDQPFIDSLVALGFDVADSSRANYALTRFSLGSMLTAGYLDALNGGLTTDDQDALARRTIQANPAFPLLRRAGYDVTVVSGGYEHLGLRSADQYIDTGQPNEFEEALAQNVAAIRSLDQLTPDRVASDIRDRTRDGLAALLQIAGEPSENPRFVLAHLPTPHSPYVFDAACGPVTPRARGPEGLGRGAADPETVAAVGAQTECLDAMITETVTELVKRRPEAVVVLLSDHGPDEHLNWWEPARLGLDERSANLFAARTPGRQDLFPNDVTLVNVLPLLFNAYLGTELPTRANEFWFGPRPQDARFVRVEPDRSMSVGGSPASVATP